MGISGAKSKLRKGGGRPAGWYKITNSRWAEIESSKSGESFIAFCFDGERPGLDKPADIRLILGPTSGKRDVTQYVEITKKGSLKSVDKENEYELGENTGPGRFFGSMSEHGVSDTIMNQVGDKPAAINGLIVHIVQEPVLDSDGEVKRNDAGYEITNTLVDKIGKEKDLKSAGDEDGSTSSKPASKKAASKKSAKKKADDDDEDDEEEEEEEEEDEDEDDEDTDDDDEDDSDDEDEEDEDEEEESDDEDEDEDEEEGAPKKKPSSRKSSKGKGKK